MAPAVLAARPRVGLMRAARIVAPGRVEMLETRMPEPSPNEVRVKLEGCGVCASNLPPWEGREWFTYPMEAGALGHEGWGTVDAIGAELDRSLLGQRVAMLSAHAYAEYDVAPADAVVPLPAELEGEPFPGEPLGCAMNIFARSGIESGQTVAILGIGFLGALLTRLTTAAGARVIAISRRNYSLEMAREFGAVETIPMLDHGQIIQQVRQLTRGQFCDVVIEATGKQWPLQLAGELTRERGRLVVAGYHQDGLREVNMQLWNWRGLDVINAHERDPANYADGIRRAVQTVASGVLEPAPLYTHFFPLDQLATALDATSARPNEFMKALVTISA